MPALRTLGLLILATFAVLVGILGYLTLRAASEESAARSAAIRVAEACGAAIASGGVQTVEVTVPGNYRMRFLDNSVLIDNLRFPEEGLELRFSDSSPELGPGPHTLSVTIKDGRLVVVRI